MDGLIEARPERRVSEIGAGFVSAVNAKVFGGGLRPSSASCGKMNHIQWLFLEPALSSASAVSKTPS